MTDPRDLLIELAAVKAQQDMLATRKGEIEQNLVNALKSRGQSTVSTTLGSGATVKGTLVEGTRVTIDADRLKGALGAPLWKKVTKQVLDNEKLEAAVALGEVDPNVVAACSTEKDVKPYVRLSGKFSPTDVIEAKVAVKRVRKPNRAG